LSTIESQFLETISTPKLAIGDEEGIELRKPFPLYFEMGASTIENSISTIEALLFPGGLPSTITMGEGSDSPAPLTISRSGSTPIGNSCSTTESCQFDMGGGAEETFHNYE